MDTGAGAGKEARGLLRRHRHVADRLSSRRSAGPSRREPARLQPIARPSRTRCSSSRTAIRRHRCRRSRAGSPPTRAAIDTLAEPDAAFLSRKVDQFQDAINTALGLDLTAVAQPAGVPGAHRTRGGVRASTLMVGGRARSDV